MSQLKLVGDLWRNVLETDGRAGNAFESDAIERQTRQLADLHLPLDERIGAWVAVHTQQQEPLALLVVAVVGVQHATDLAHHFHRVHCACCLHAPREPQRARLHQRLVGCDCYALRRRHRAAAGHVVTTMFMHWPVTKLFTLTQAVITNLSIIAFTALAAVSLACLCLIWLCVEQSFNWVISCTSSSMYRTPEYQLVSWQTTGSIYHNLDANYFLLWCQMYPGCERKMHSQIVRPTSTQPSILHGTLKWVPAKGRWCSAVGKVTAGLAESYGSLLLGGWLKSPACWLPVHRDQLRAQRSVTSMGSLYFLYIVCRLTAKTFDNSSVDNSACMYGTLQKFMSIL